MHAVLHRLGFRDGKDVDADGDGVGIGEAHGFDVGHAGFLAGNTPAERLRPEPADRGVIPGIHRNLNKPQRHAANPMLSWLGRLGEPDYRSSAKNRLGRGGTMRPPAGCPAVARAGEMMAACRRRTTSR